jgi:scyllo-inositol 2-dehydrogenase (NADP+)
VVVNTPHSLHFEMALRVLEANKHVVVEKPMAMAEKQVAQLYEAARNRNLLITCFQNRRFDSDFLTFKQVVIDKRVGDWKEARLHFDRFRPEPIINSWKEGEMDDSGILLNLGPHLIDQAIVLFGKPDWVQADIRKTRQGSVSDDAFEIVLAYSEKRCILSVSYHVPGKPLKFSIHGTKGSWLKHGEDGQEVLLKSGVSPLSPEFGIEKPENFGVFCSLTNGTFEYETTPSSTGNYLLFYDQVFKAIRQGKPMEILEDEIALQHRIIELAKQSSLEGKRIWV